jgi:hypothetical protein
MTKPTIGQTIIFYGTYAIVIGGMLYVIFGQKGG